MPDILIVDDDPKLGRGVEHVLARAGYSCTYCEEPLEAARQLGSAGYKVLLTDMKLPQITGLELLIWARNAYPSLQFLMMTAYPVESFENLALAGGALKILPKPFSSEDLLRQIRLCMAPGLAANVERIQLADLLQVLALDPNGRLLEIVDTRRKATARLGIVHQTLCYADWQRAGTQLTGWDACCQALAIEEGCFREGQLSEVSPNLRTPLQDALLTVAAQQDDSAKYQGFGRQFSRVLCYSHALSELQVLLKVLANQAFKVEALSELGPELPEDCSVLFHLSEPGDLARLRAACAAHPHTPFVLLDARRHALETPTAPNLVQRFAAPWDLRALSACLRGFHQLGLSGHLANLGLLSQLQLCLMSPEPKRLSIKNMSQKTSGTLYLAGHAILEAQVGAERGETAFRILTQAQNGIVMELDWEPPPSTSLAEVPPIRLFMSASCDLVNLADLQTLIIQKVEAYL